MHVFQGRTNHIFSNAVAGFTIGFENGFAVYLLRLDPASGRVTARLRYLPADRAFRAPTQLATGHGSIWLLAPTRTETARHDAVVLRVSADATVQSRVNAPSSLFVGGLAVT